VVHKPNAKTERSNADIQISSESPHHNARKCYASKLLSSEMPDPEEQDSPNRTITDALRQTFAAIANRLTPEVEPATIYRPYELASDPSSRVDEPE
jgi:hypothetical protein